MGGEGRSRKRRSSPSPNPSQDDEERSAKHRKRRDERERKEKKKSKSEKSHGSSRNRDGKEKKSKDKSKRSRKDDDSDFKELSKDDYFSKNNEFATWLKEERGIYFSDLSSDAARDLFSKFVKEWNSRNLESRYYQGIASGVRSAHNWKIKT
ncbi:protein PXR1-like [Ananas comosus]|uniref:Protein PXR1-like n=1 Tax=Ananas comosus TaxID=4615 RepID=A0A199V2Q9_ANACO|nr:protein PXR1-like [Ananas comosus]OAY71181.1 hypothetical protein ACMD2_09235 [Ananas comosus]